MYCIKCGTQNSDDSIFCKRCGQKVPRESDCLSGAPAIGISATSATTTRKANYVVEAVKSVGKSGLVLTIAIFCTIYLLLNVGSIITQIIAIVEEELYDFSNSVVSLSTQIISCVVSCISLCCFVFILIGIWNLYQASRKEGIPSTGGLVLIKLGAIFNWVKALLALSAYITCTVVIFLDSFSFSTNLSEFDLRVSVIFVIRVSVIYGVGAVCYSKLSQSASIVKRTIVKQKEEYEISSFVGVMCFVSALYQVGSIVSLAVELEYSSDMGSAFYAIEIVRVVVLSTILVMVGVLLFKYKNRMKQCDNYNLR